MSGDLTEREREAVANSEMISPSESWMRKTIGSAFVAGGGGLYLTGYCTPAILAAALSAGFATIETGRKNVWGCVLEGKWKPSNSKRIPFPEQLKDFMLAKQADFKRSIVGGIAAGVIATVAVYGLHAKQPLDAKLAVQIAYGVAGLLAFSLVFLVVLPKAMTSVGGGGGGRKKIAE